MRKFLLASAATLGAGGLVGSALAQAPAGPVGAPTQGQVAYPLEASPSVGANNVNNYQAAQLPGNIANPTPGTIVIHINGRVAVEAMGLWSSVDTVPRTITGTTTPTGASKLAPYNISYYARLWFGADAMANNGLRYGAAIEIRQNNAAFAASTTSDGASGYTSLQTLFVRRAFTYVAGENWGIVRLGNGDGPISIFDNGVTTFQFLPTGNLGGGDLQNWPGNVNPSFVFDALQGAEYGPAKAVYLSPQIAGFDFGLSYAPNPANGFATCNTATVAGASGCATLSSGPGSLDGARFMNAVEAGVRYQGEFGPLGVLAYGVYMFSGHANYTGPAAGTVAGNANLGIDAASFGGGATGAQFAAATRYNGNFNGLNLGNGGVALTYAGFTVGGNIIGGAVNGQLALEPKNGAPLLGYLLGAKYVTGPWTVGITGEEYWEQGTVQLTGISQRRARGLSAGFSYAVAPGFSVFGEYQYVDQTQSGFNFATGAVGSSANNTVKGQGFLIGNIVNF
jgi:hypothetical protein